MSNHSSSSVLLHSLFTMNFKLLETVANLPCLTCDRSEVPGHVDIVVHGLGRVY